jgi:hypothetical protein
VRRFCAVLVLVVLAACGGPTDEVRAGSPPDDSPVTSPSTSPAPSVPGRAMTLQPRDGLRNVLPIEWDRAEVADDGAHVDVWFMGGVDACWGLARTEATSGAGTLTIALEGGEIPQDAACPELGVTYVTRIPLDEPVAPGVRLVDGTA